MHLEHWERLTRGFHGYRLFMQVQPYVGTLDGRKKWDYWGLKSPYFLSTFISPKPPTLQHMKHKIEGHQNMQILSAENGKDEGA